MQYMLFCIKRAGSNYHGHMSHGFDPWVQVLYMIIHNSINFKYSLITLDARRVNKSISEYGGLNPKFVATFQSLHGRLTAIQNFNICLDICDITR